MNKTDILFVHNNFPAQYRHVARALAADSRFRVFAFGSRTASAIPGIQLFRYFMPEAAPAIGLHPFARRFEDECRRAEQVMYLANVLRAENISPRIIFVHPGWGESLPLRVLFPDAVICLYCEFYYHPVGADVGFDKEFPELGIDGLVRVGLRNATTLLSLTDADVGISPTRWQRATYPSTLQSKISVLHDGIDIETAKPDPSATLTLPSGLTLRPGDEVVTFVSRNLEPYRGFHIFMRALPEILRARPNLQVLIIGGTGLSYGAPSPSGRSWASIFHDEVKDSLDPNRVHMLGWLDRPSYLSALQVSAAHVYLTYPFVLSWSLLEAMATGCLIVGSETPPLEEVIEHGRNGLLVPFFNPGELARAIIAAVRAPGQHAGLRREARRTVLERYARERVVPQHLAMVERLMASARKGGRTPGNP